MEMPQRKTQSPPPVGTDNLADLILSRALAPTPEGARKLAEMLSSEATTVTEAIRCAPENPRAQQWLDSAIQKARERYRLAPKRKPVQQAAPLAPQRVAAHREMPEHVAPSAKQKPTEATAHEPACDNAAGSSDLPAQAVATGQDRGGCLEGVDTIHVYGKAHALTFEASETRGKGSGAGLPTIMVEAAGAGTASKTYNWADKLRFQVTAQELPFVAAVFFGKLAKVEFANHGENADKGISLEDQPERGGVYVKLWARGHNHVVPVPTGSIAPIAALCLRQLQKQFRLDADGTERVMCAAARRYRPKPDRAPANYATG